MMITTANIITFLRIVLTPIFIYVYLKYQYPLPLILFTIITLTDAFDGLVARISKQCTYTGAFLDTAADKLLLLSTLFVFVLKSKIPNWFFATILIRDAYIIIGWFIVYRMTKDISVKPRVLGKFAVILEMLIAFMILFNVSQHYVDIFCYVTVFCTLCSMIDYSYAAYIRLSMGKKTK